MKKHYFFTLIIVVLFLNSCSPAQTQNVIITSEVTVTSAPTNTSIPTNTPTSTPDPLAGAPEGTTKVVNGKYIKEVFDEELNKTLEFEYIKILNANNDVIFEGWTSEKTQKDGIPLWDFSDFNLIPMSLFVANDVLGSHNISALTHEDNIDQPINIDTLTSAALADLFQRHFGKSAKELSQQETLEYRLSVVDGTARLPFILSTGEKVEGILSPKTGFITIVVPYDSLIPVDGDGISEWLDPYPDSRSYFRSTVLGVDKDGNIIGLIASKKPINELPDKLIRMLILYHAGNIIYTENQTEQGFPAILQFFITQADKTGDELIPDIIIERNP